MRTFLGRCLGIGVLTIGALAVTGGTVAAAPTAPAIGGGGGCKELTIDLRAKAVVATTYADATTGFQVHVSHVSWSGPGHKKLRFDFTANAHVQAVVATTNVDVLTSKLHLPTELLGHLTSGTTTQALASVDLDLSAWIGVSIDAITFCWTPGPDTPPGPGDGTPTTTTTSSTTTTTTRPVTSSPTTAPGSTTTSVETGGPSHPPTTNVEVTATGDLPDTGSTPGPLVALGAALLVLGGVAVAGSHRLRARRRGVAAPGAPPPPH